jgi:hypothetical protein
MKPNSSVPRSLHLLDQVREVIVTGTTAQGPRRKPLYI